MNGLLHYLPPFASDYSGVASALHGMGSMTILCDAGCCTDQYIFYDEPRWAEQQEPVFSTTLRTVDAVLGCDAGIVERCVAMVGSLNVRPAFIALIATPVPAIVGMDARGVACEIESALGIPALGFDTTGFRFYDWGIEAVPRALVDRFGPEAPAVASREVIVNLLGATPLDFGDVGMLERTTDALALHGIRVNVCLPGAGGTDRISHIADAHANLALTASGVGIARMLERRYGTPYAIGCPYGPVGGDIVAALADAIRSVACGEQPSGFAPLHPSTGRKLQGHDGGPYPPDGESAAMPVGANERVLVIGDQVMAQSVRADYAARHPEARIAVASPFGWRKELAAPGDFHFKGEQDLIDEAKAFGPQTVVADPLYGFLADTLDGCTLIPKVHPAISGKLHWKDARNPIT